jgi:hypothetical protein
MFRAMVLAHLLACARRHAALAEPVSDALDDVFGRETHGPDRVSRAIATLSQCARHVRSAKAAATLISTGPQVCVSGCDRFFERLRGGKSLDFYLCAELADQMGGAVYAALDTRRPEWMRLFHGDMVVARPATVDEVCRPWTVRLVCRGSEGRMRWSVPHDDRVTDASLARPLLRFVTR